MYPKEYKKLFGLFSRGDITKLILLFAMMMGSAILEILGIGMIPAFVAIVANPKHVLENERFVSFFQFLNISSARELLIYGSVSFIGIFIIKNAYTLLFRYIEARFIYNRRYVLSHKLMRSYMQAPYTFYLQRNTAELHRNTAIEVNLLINSVLKPILILSKEILMALFVIVFLILLEPVLTIVVSLLMGSITGIFMFATQKRIKQYGVEDQIWRVRMLKSIRQGFGGIKEARVLKRENEFIEEFRITALESSTLQRKRTFISQIPKPVIETLAVGGIMMIAIIMTIQGRPIGSIIPVLALFGMAIIRLMPSVQQITQMLTEIKYHLPSVNPIYDDLSLLRKSGVKFKADRNKVEKFELTNCITINNLRYCYPNSDTHALNGIDLTIERGKAVAFVGASGAGKTTIVDLLLGLLEPTEGQVLVDGHNVFGNISAWQRNIGYIPQFIYLTDDTIRRNIAFGLPEEKIDERRVLDAVKLAQLADLVERLPDGVSTMIGELGTRLSGGQRQRIGIARALYHTPQVLVMDEATSALDNVTEQLIIEAIEALKGERTVIMIAHRLTTVMNCDVIFYMEEGKIIDQGTYQELLQRNIKFNEMAKSITNTV